MRKLVVCVDLSLMGSEEVKALNPKTVEVLPLNLNGADLVIGPQCWYMPASHLRYLSVAVKEARTMVRKGEK